MQLMQKIAPLALVVFVVSSMLAMGLGLTVGGIVAPLRDVRRVVLSLLANFVLVPLAAVGIAYLQAESLLTPPGPWARTRDLAAR